MWLRRCIQFPKSNFRCFASSAAEPNIKITDYRTIETNPTKHTIDHIGRFYTVDPELKKNLFTQAAIPRRFHDEIKTFTEMSLLIRSPAVEIINYMNNTDYSKPVNRFVLYGELGAGKTAQLLHLLHYGFVNDFIIVHVPWVPNWFKQCKEKSNSTTKEGFLDINLDAAAWLNYFKTQNMQLLEKLNLKCLKEYVWSQREVTSADSSLLELIEHGINRVKFASDTIAVLFEELKAHSTAGKCRTMVAIDGFNAFFHPETRIKFDNRVKATPENITITEPFLNITRADWCNGVCILIADKWALTKDRMESNLPKYLLYRKGFEHLDPFIPIRVDLYNDSELDSVINYYKEKKWISVQDVEKDIKFLSGGNGYNLREITASL